MNLVNVLGMARAPKNFETAFDHYLKAAEDGSSEAKAAIGRAFFWVKSGRE